MGRTVGVAVLLLRVLVCALPLAAMTTAVGAPAGQTPADDLDPSVAAAIADGWEAARALARVGGARGPIMDRVNEVLRRLDASRREAERGATPRDAARARQLQYADAAMRAAVDAAQDERAEMAVFLAQARHLAEQLELMGRAARLPLPVDELEGELWLEVDRYDEAREAYRRASAKDPSARVWMGLARASARSSAADEACHAYRRVLDLQAPPEWRREARLYVESAVCGRR